MHGHHGPGARRDGRCYSRWVDVESAGQHVHQHRFQAQQRRRFQRSHVGEGGDNDLGPGGQFQAHQGQGEGIGAVGAGHYAGAAEVRAQLRQQTGPRPGLG